MPRTEAALRVTEAYHDRITQIADHSARLASAGLDPSDIQMSIAQATEYVEVGQQAAVDLTTGYFAALQGLEVGKNHAIDPLELNVGRTADGRTLLEALGATRARFLKGAKDGASIEKLSNEAVSSINRLAHFETIDAGSRELVFQIESSPHAAGWRSKSRGTCGACISQDSGKVLSGSILRPPFHPHCRCIPEPAFKVPDKVRRPTGHDRFATMSEAEQTEILGDKAKLLRAGLIEFKHLVLIERFQEWTPVVTERPLDELLVIAGITAAQLQDI